MGVETVMKNNGLSDYWCLVGIASSKCPMIYLSNHYTMILKKPKQNSTHQMLFDQFCSFWKLRINVSTSNVDWLNFSDERKEKQLS